QVRSEGQRPRQRLRDLGLVLVSQDLVGAEVAVDLGEGVVLRRLPPRAGDAGSRVDDQRVGREQARVDQRSQGQRRRGRVASRVCDEPGGGRRQGKLGKAVERLGEEVGAGV